MRRNRDRYRTTSGQEGRQLVFAVPPVIVKSILDQVCMMRFKKRGTRRSNANVCSAQSAACARFNRGREEGGTGALMSSARHFFSPPPLSRVRFYPSVFIRSSHAEITERDDFRYDLCACVYATRDAEIIVRPSSLIQWRSCNLC